MNTYSQTTFAINTVSQTTFDTNTYSQTTIAINQLFFKREKLKNENLQQCDGLQVRGIMQHMLIYVLIIDLIFIINPFPDSSKKCGFIAILHYLIIINELRTMCKGWILDQVRTAHRTKLSQRNCSPLTLHNMINIALFTAQNTYALLVESEKLFSSHTP